MDDFDKITSVGSHILSKWVDCPVDTDHYRGCARKL